MPEHPQSSPGTRSSAPVDRDSVAPFPFVSENVPSIQAGQISPALVAEVTEKVYRLLLADLRIERERRR